MFDFFKPCKDCVGENAVELNPDLDSLIDDVAGLTNELILLEDGDGRGFISLSNMSLMCAEGEGDA